MSHTSHIPIYLIHDVIETFNYRNDLWQYSESHIDQTVLYIVPTNISKHAVDVDYTQGSYKEGIKTWQFCYYYLEENLKNYYYTNKKFQLSLFLIQYVVSLCYCF